AGQGGPVGPVVPAQVRQPRRQCGVGDDRDPADLDHAGGVPQPGDPGGGVPDRLGGGGAGHGVSVDAHSRRLLRAHAVSSCREDSCSLRSTEDTWVSTVLTEMNRSRATSLYWYHRAMRRISSRSRALSRSSSSSTSAISPAAAPNASRTKPARRGLNTASPSATRVTARASSAPLIVFVT